MTQVMQRKICMLGAFGVGKTSLVARFVHSLYSEKYQTSLGVKIDKKTVAIDGQEQMLMLWDMAGEDAVTQVRPSHLKGGSGYLLVVDGCRAETLATAIDLQRRASDAMGPVPFILAVNKADLREKWEIQQSELDALVGQGWRVSYTSAKTGDGVESMFHDLAKAMLKESDVRAQAVDGSGRQG